MLADGRPLAAVQVFNAVSMHEEPFEEHEEPLCQWDAMDVVGCFRARAYLQVQLSLAGDCIRVLPRLCSASNSDPELSEPRLGQIFHTRFEADERFGHQIDHRTSYPRRHPYFRITSPKPDDVARYQESNLEIERRSNLFSRRQESTFFCLVSHHLADPGRFRQH